MSAAVSFSDVERMLKKCAPGYRIELKTHFRFVYWGSLVFPALPKHDNIYLGHVRKLARAFNILNCARTELGIP
jgi:hypothetical protein